MPAELLRSRPGVTFETVSPPLDEALPRMDVAVFVGFAASGPVNVPVAIEQPAEFAHIFGADVVLAWQRGRGGPAYAHLGPSVRAFFRNGGRRCWVIRAGVNPVVNTFPLPDLVTWTTNATTTPTAVAQARSGGSWSDAVEVAVQVRRDSIKPANVSIGPAFIDLSLPSGAKVEDRDLLRLWFGNAHHIAFGGVSSIERRESELRVHLEPVLWFTDLSSPPTGSLVFTGTIAPPSLPLTDLRTEILHIDLLARDEGAEIQRASNLGLVEGHRRYWSTLLQTDTDFFAPLADATVNDVLVDRRTPVSERFPLAGWPAPPVKTGDPIRSMTIPITVATEPRFSACNPPTAPAAERDGLAVFDPSVFVDGRLHDASANALPAMAAAIRYYGANPPQVLGGIHAAFFIEEATLIAVPDAVHPSWSAENTTEAEEPPAEIAAEPAPPDPCATSLPFEVCDPPRLPVPVLDPLTLEPGNTITLSWNAVPGAERYTVEEGDAPRFTNWYAIATTTHTGFTVYHRTPGAYGFRVRALFATQTGLASVGRTIRIPATPRVVVETSLVDTEQSALIELHRALLRMCAARSDMVAVLSLPETYRETDALEHARRLTSASIESTLSYGVLYHPWTITSEDAGATLRSMPPDGAACGVIARRALARGAWVAPANETFTGVVALTPALRDDTPTLRQLLTAQLNVITREPAGFMTLNADTLSTDTDLRQLNVRRLLILLRKRALQVGNRYVFEPNGPALSRQVQRGFEDMLGYLYERGAFAGPTAPSSYQVVVSEAVNTQQLRDRGQFIVELRVAPSWPLTFLRVRLLQHGDRLSVAEVR